MSNTNIRKLFIGVVLIFLFTLAGCIQVYEDPIEPTEPAGEPIVLGALLPLSGPGTAYGVPAQKVLQIAADEINAEGGVDGKPIKFEFNDGGCNVETAKAATENLINLKGVKVIIGGICAAETLTAAPIAEENHVVLFSYASSNQAITKAGDYIFRNFPSDETQGIVLADYATKQGYKKVGALVEEHALTEGIAAAFTDTFSGETIVKKYPTDSSDFSAQVAELQAAEADAFLLVVQTPEKAELLFEQLQKAGVKGPFLLGDAAIGISDDIMIKYRDFLEGSVGTRPGYDKNHPGVVALQEKYLEQEGGQIPYMYAMAPAYDAVYIIKEAIDMVGEDPVKIKAYLYSVKGRKGLAGTLSFDENGDSNYMYDPVIIKDGVVGALE